MLGIAKRLIRSERAAVAPVVALSLVGLIACGGIAFDYARLAAMDTELQNAADQAALAAATQLDRLEDSQTRAIAAVQGGTATGRLANNNTRFANDGGGAAIAITAVTFCESFDDDVADTDAACEEADAGDGENSRFVIVTTELRTANYALTPIVAALSGVSAARAVAGVESSLCNVAPLLVCVPDDFPSASDVGRGIVMKPLDGISGNYGLLDFGNGANAVTAALMGFGLNGCQSSDDNETEPGTKTQVTDAINTRMDVYDKTNPNVWSNKDGTPECDLTDGSGCPAANTAKDVIRTEKYVVNTDPTLTTPPAAPACGGPAPGVADEEFTLGPAFELNAAGKGFDRDECHYTDTCPGTDKNLGDKAWDRAGYIAKHHPGVTLDDIATDLDNGRTGAQLTRYDIYNWELDNDVAANTLAPRAIAQTMTSEVKKVKGKDRKVWTFTKQCRYHRPLVGSAAYPAQKDRRVLPIVAANCEELRGKGAAYEDYVLLRAFDVFLTEPSLKRDATVARPVGTENKEIYGEVVGPATTFEGGSGFQYYARSKPYLIR